MRRRVVVLAVAVVTASTAFGAQMVIAAVSDTAATASHRLRSGALAGPVDVAAIGDRVWRDEDGDGLQGPGEPGVDGVTVSLLDADGHPVLLDAHGGPISPQTTRTVGGEAGHYRFEALAPGRYRVAFSDLPAGHRFTVAGGLPGDGTDSDADPGDGRTGVIDLVAGRDDDTVDAGLWVPAPGLALVKRAQGDDAPDAPGPLVPQGTTVSFDYLVTNRGNEAVTDLDVTDDRGVDVSCPAQDLAVGDTMACSGTDAAVVGPYRNVGTATARGARSHQEVSASDDAHYLGVGAGIDVEATLDGHDADTAADAVLARAGDTLTHEVTVANTGTDTVVDLVVVDDGIGAITCPATELGPGDSMDCTATTLVVAPGLQVNVTTATGTTATDGEALGDTDPTNHRGHRPVVTLLEEVLDPASGQWVDGDADAGTPGSNDGYLPTLLTGSTAHYRLTVANEGDTPILDPTVAEDRCDAAPVLVAGDHAPQGVLDIGERWRYRCSVAGVTGPAVNTATVRATTVVGSPEGDGSTERAGIEVAGSAAVGIEKLVRDPATGAFVAAATVPTDAAATWRLRVSNPGHAPLVDLDVTDPAIPACGRRLDGPLAPGATSAPWTCTSPPVHDPLVNVATVVARPVTGAPRVTASASARVDPTAPPDFDLRLTKHVHDQSGPRATFRLVVTNRGPGAVPGPVTLVDDLPDGLLAVSARGAGWSCTIQGRRVRCTHRGPLAAGQAATAYVVTRIAPGAPARVTNRAVLVGAADTDPANDTGAAVLDTTGSAPGPDDPGDPGRPGGPGGTGGTGSGDRPGGGRLVATGAEVLGLVAVGLGLVGAGVLLVVAARQRRRERVWRPLP